ncbi:MAG: NAD+ synthase [Methanobrevibacter sp.]|uniref:NH(3)-dependent NAD(+) synthetase n=1 Tax=Methanobrevibacter millerae TaxID=230361 RepID=A0A8T3VGG8_9EURY|nr:NAD+ synthase [Methanobrevibacter millerae]MBE6505246.1 NAD+ synthase [Methanobrevibacter millerae]MBR0369649.1 NAD+ synthase [Methanobrevibacter sp.]
MNEIPKINVEKTKNDIVEFVQNKVSEANAAGLVVGLSGGIDSTVAAFLACEAVGKENVFGVVLPSTTTPTEDKLHGTAIAQLLGINYKEMAIDSILNEFLSVTQLEEDIKAIGNLKARIRMSIIYFYANSKNYLVSGTGNKSEISIGYFTKHGDGACDIEPIGDLYKTDVFELAKYLGVPQEIIDKPPRAGLWNNQTDEDEIGMTYELLDKILYRFIEKEIDAKSIADELDIEVDEVNDIIDRVERNNHKTKVPECPKKTLMVI